MFLYATKKDAPRPFGPTPLVQLLGRISDKSASISIVCKMKKRAPFGNYEFNSNTQIIPGYLKQLLPQNIVEMNSTKPELKTNKFLSLPSTPPTWLTFQHLPPPPPFPVHESLDGVFQGTLQAKRVKSLVFPRVRAWYVAATVDGKSPRRPPNHRVIEYVPLSIYMHMYEYIFLKNKIYVYICMYIYIYPTIYIGFFLNTQGGCLLD